MQYPIWIWRDNEKEEGGGYGKKLEHVFSNELTTCVNIFVPCIDFFIFFDIFSADQIWMAYLNETNERGCALNLINSLYLSIYAIYFD